MPKSGEQIQGTKPSVTKQADFLDIAPPSSGPEPKKIAPRWHSDEESFLEVDADIKKRRKALSSDAGHDKTVANRERRIAHGLPEDAISFKERIIAIHALTPSDLAIIKEQLGHKWDMNQYAPFTQEVILHELQEYKERQKQLTKKG